LPRKGFKTITVKEGVFDRFTKIIKLAKKEKPEMSNSKFLTELLNLYERATNNLPVARD
jgi:hypothetical protein